MSTHSYDMRVLSYHREHGYLVQFDPRNKDLDTVSKWILVDRNIIDETTILEALHHEAPHDRWTELLRLSATDHTSRESIVGSTHHYERPPEEIVKPKKGGKKATTPEGDTK